MIQGLYANPTVSNWKNMVILVQHRQLQPPVLSSVSPMRFALSLEPLVQAARQPQHHDPITVFGTDHHISLYADDILLFVGNTPQSLPNLLSILKSYGSMSTGQHRLYCP
jgi:hypothetical protein